MDSPDVIIVGNGPCLRDGPGPDVIDSYPVVIRINDWRVTDFSGRRCTYWYTTKPFEKDSAQRPERGIVFINRGQPLEVPVWANSATPCCIYREMCRRVRQCIPNANPTSGLLIIHWWLRMRLNVAVCGFNMMQRDAPLHYWKQKQKIGDEPQVLGNSSHMHEAEKFVFAPWLDSKRVIIVR